MERKVVDKYHSLNGSDKWIATTKDTLDKYWNIKTGFSSPQTSESLNKTNDNVNHPSHYNQGGIETIDYIKSRLTREEFQGFCKGNILKYCSRSNLKNGEEDLRKMNYYSNKLMQVLDEKV